MRPSGETMVENDSGTFGGVALAEWLALAEIVLNLSGCRSVLRRQKGQLEAGGQNFPAIRASCPHLNCFCFGEFGRLLAAAGIAVDRYRSCIVLCSNLVNSLIRRFRLNTWNAYFAERLPVWCASEPIRELQVGQPARAAQSQQGAGAIWRKGPNHYR
jgi:hypothetical protein